MEPTELMKMRFEVLTVMLLAVEVLWNVMPCHWVVAPDVVQEYSASKTKVSTHKMIQHHIPEDMNLQLLIVKLQ
jgi:hypothetical protein